jgi:hypothetical protein
MSTIDPAEFEKLKAEVAALREFVEGFLSVNRNREGEIRERHVKGTFFTCQNLEVTNREGEGRVYVEVGEDGPCVALWGDDHRARAMVKVVKNAGEVSLYDAELKPTAQLWTDREGHGNLCVYSPGGVPRAGMKGMAMGGVVSVMDPGGSAKAVLVSEQGEGGRVVVANGENELVAQIVGAPSGGVFALSDTNGVKKCCMVAKDEGGTLLINGPEGKVGALMMATDQSSMLSLHGGEEDIDQKPHTGVTIHGLRGQGGSIGIRNAQGTEVVRMISHDTGASVEAVSADEKTRVTLHGGSPASMVTVTDDETEAGATITTDKQGGKLFVHKSGGKTGALVNCDEHGGTFSIMETEKNRVPLHLGLDNEQRAVVRLQNADNSTGVVLFTHEHGGSVLVNGSDGVIHAGVAAGEQGGRLTVFSELGIERATVRSMDDGGQTILKWGGINMLVGAATERGGGMVVTDHDGKTIASFPHGDWGDGQEDEE